MKDSSRFCCHYGSVSVSSAYMCALKCKWRVGVDLFTERKVTNERSCETWFVGEYRVWKTR